MKKSTFYSSGSLRRQIFKVMGIGIASLFTFSMANAQMSGAYTINSNNPTSGNNFANYADFMSALTTNSNAIAGPVTVTVAPNTGPYNEQLVLPSISGAGPGPGGTRVGITFIGNGTTIQYDASKGSENATITLNGADYVTFQNLNIVRTAVGSYKWGVRIYGQSDNIRFDSCTIDVGTAYTTSNWVALLASASNTSSSSGNNCFDNLEIWNSTIKGGYYGVRAYATSTSGENAGFDLINSNIIDQYYYGMYHRYCRDNVVRGTTFDKPTQSYEYGYAYYFYYCNNIEFTKNHMLAFNYGSYFYYANYTNTSAGDECYVANNFYSQNNHTQTYARGIYTYRSNDLKVYNNSVNINKSTGTYSGTCYPFYAYYSNNIDVRNNIFASTTSSNNYVYFYQPTGNIAYDYNTFYSENPNQNWYMYYMTTNYSSPSSLIQSSGTNQNSQEMDPGYVSNLDCHITGANMYQKGIAIASVTDDYDGTLRPATMPSHGAHEFTPPQNDAGVLTFTQPIAQCPDTNQIIVTVRNYGIQSLDSVRVYWSYTGNGAPANGIVNLVCSPAIATGADTTIFLSNVVMTSGAPGYNFTAYTSMPNGVTDEKLGNDTSHFYTQTAMVGDFTIGGTTPDFATFNDAVNALETYGVCGPVTMYARSGTYPERLALTGLLGVSSTNTVMFTVDTNNSAPVLLQYSSSGSSDRAVVYLKDVAWVTIDGFDLQNNGGSYANGVYADGQCDHITISNINFSNTSTSSLNNPIEFYPYYLNVDDINIINNNVSGGYYGIRVYGYNGTGSPGVHGITITGNTISNAYYYGMYLYYIEDAVIHDNYIDMSGGNSYTYSYGLQCYGYGQNYDIQRNRIHSNYYGMYMYSISGTNSNRGTIANNKVLLGDTLNGLTIGYYAMYLSNSGFMNVAHNTIVSQTTNGYVAYINGGLNHLYNNIFSRVNSGTIMTISGSFSVTEADNNAYSALNGASQGLTYMQGLGYDANGVSVAQLFDTLSIDKMTTCNDTLVGAGAPLSYITDDIDGGGRSATGPAIGPHEYISAGGFTLGEDLKICDGDMLVLGSEIVGATYVWTPNGDTTGTIIVTSPGTYGVTVNSECGVGQDEVVVADASSAANFSNTRSWLTNNFTNLSVNGLTYLWEFGDGSTSTDMNPTHLYSANGIYNVCLTAYGDCDTNKVCMDVEAHDATGINENNGANAISMYPNPASNSLTVKTEGVAGNVLSIEISNISGQLVLNSQLNDFDGYTQQDLDISTLTQGVYFVKIFTSEVATTKRLVVKK